MPPSVEEKGFSAKEPHIEVGSEDSDEDGEVDRPGQKYWANMVIDTNYEDGHP